MDENELERRLSEAFTAHAGASVSDFAAPPAPRFLTDGAADKRHRRLRVLAPLAAAAAVLLVVGSVLLLRDTSTPATRPIAGASGSVASSHLPSATPSRGAGAPVRIRLLNADGQTYGVGMPVVAYFSRKFANAGSLSAATSITINGKSVRGAWYFERSSARPGYPIEGHLRLASYWPAHAKIHVRIAADGISGGPGFAFTNSASLDFVTGSKNVAIVDDAKHRMAVMIDGKQIGNYPVSLGLAATPTSRGIKVIMAKGSSITMRGPGYFESHVKYTQRLTYAGEYLHAAPWNTLNIKDGVDTSNGCTNLLPSDAAFLYRVLRVGDVVEYPDADGPPMTVGAGFGDWNVSWTTWQRGGLIPTS